MISNDIQSYPYPHPYPNTYPIMISNDIRPEFSICCQESNYHQNPLYSQTQHWKRLKLIKILTSPDFHLQWEDPSRCPVVGDQAPDLFFTQWISWYLYPSIERGQQGNFKWFQCIVHVKDILARLARLVWFPWLDTTLLKSAGQIPTQKGKEMEAIT